MNGMSHPAGPLGALANWILETFGLSQSRDAERKRLAALSTKQHHEGYEEIGPHTVAVPLGGDLRSTFGDENDNYLRGELIQGKRDEAARHSQEVLTNWLQQGDCLGCRSNGDYRDHSCGKNSQWDGADATYEQKETRLVDFSEIGLGMSRDNLTKFVFSSTPATQQNQRTPDFASKKTVQDIPAMQFNFDRVESLPADASSRPSQKSKVDGR